MIINDRSVKGIFQYSDDITFEKGDFVVLDNSLYIVKSDTVGKSPNEYPELFEPYQRGDIATYEDFISGDYTKNDKLISSSVLNEVMSTFLSGFSESGLINNSITADKNIVFNNLLNTSSTVISSKNNSKDPLDIVLETQNLNNAIFEVDYEVAKNIFPKTSQEGSGVVLFLRQFTYIDRKGIVSSTQGGYIRIQELTKISTIGAEIAYRYVISNGQDYNVGASTQWKMACTNSEFLKNLSLVKNYYLSELNKYLNLETVMANNFKFKSVNLSATNKNAVEISYGIGKPQIPLNRYSTEPFLMTILTKKSVGGGSFRTYSTTLDLATIVNSAEKIQTYVIENDISLQVTHNSDNQSIIFATSINSIIYGMYYQQRVSGLDSSIIKNAPTYNGVSSEAITVSSSSDGFPAVKSFLDEECIFEVTVSINTNPIKSIKAIVNSREVCNQADGRYDWMLNIGGYDIKLVVYPENDNSKLSFNTSISGDNAPNCWISKLKYLGTNE